VDEKSGNKGHQLCLKVKFCVQIRDFPFELGFTKEGKIKLEILKAHHKIRAPNKLILQILLF
jgi:hypothetical protein